MEENKNPERNPEIRIENVNKNLHKDLKYIASQIEGVPLASFLKPKLREIRDQYLPEIIRRRSLEE